MAEGTDIDATSCTEHIECVERAESQREIGHFADDKNEAAKVAKRNVDGSDELSFLTDESRLDTRRTDASVN